MSYTLLLCMRGADATAEVRLLILETLHGLHLQRNNENKTKPRKYSYPSLGYPGGKKRIAPQIISQMPPHETYVEPFAGAAHVFFNKNKSEKNVLNDINKELITFFKDIKGKNICCKVNDTRMEFNKRRNKSKKSICDYVYLNKTSYGGKDVFDGTPSYANRKKIRNKEICITGNNLINTNLHSLDFKEVVKKYDHRDTLFYIDPPYVKANIKECLYGKERCAVTPKDVVDSIKNIKGKAIISYDDHPEVRKAFKGYKIDKIELPYSFARSNGKIKGKTNELLIKNYRCKRTSNGLECSKIDLNQK